MFVPRQTSSLGRTGGGSPRIRNRCRAVIREVQSYLDQVVSALTIHVGAELIGVYLHGSLAMGAFHPGRSDIDILAVCAEPFTVSGAWS